MRIRAFVPTFGRSTEGGTVKKALTITLAAIVLIALAATTALFALAAVDGPQQRCGRVNPAELREPADPAYGAELADLARCGH